MLRTFDVMFWNFVGIFILGSISLTKTQITLSKVDMRQPKLNDIGLIFDVTLVHIVASPGENRTPLDAKIDCEKCCICQLENDMNCDVAPMIGGSFGAIPPADSKVVSIFWPTQTVYDRLGYCDLIITSINAREDNQTTSSYTIHFDTRISSVEIPEYMKGFTKDLNITMCESPDHNPLAQCDPVDCDEKYFGSRNYFNLTSQLCEKVPNCTGKDLMYDFIINECVDRRHRINAQELNNLKSGVYDNFEWKFDEFMQIPNKDVWEYGPINKNRNSQYTKNSTFWGLVLTGLIMLMFVFLFYFFFCFCLFVIILLLGKATGKSPTIEPTASGTSFNNMGEEEE